MDRERGKHKDTIVEKEDLLFIEKSKRKVNWGYNILEMSVLLDSMVFQFIFSSLVRLRHNG